MKNNKCSEKFSRKYHKFQSQKLFSCAKIVKVTMILDQTLSPLVKRRKKKEVLNQFIEKSIYTILLLKSFFFGKLKI